MFTGIFRKKIAGFHKKKDILNIEYFYKSTSLYSFIVLGGVIFFPGMMVVAQTVGGTGGNTRSGQCAPVTVLGGGPGQPGSNAPPNIIGNCGGQGGGGGGAGGGAGGAGGLSNTTLLNGAGGAGGVGGTHGHVIDVMGETYNNQVVLSGGDGLQGGRGNNPGSDGAVIGGGGGGGGAGGFGLVVNQAATIVNDVNGSIFGGAGGDGGTGGNGLSSANSGSGGDAGDGGIGIWLRSDNITVSNAGIVRGGTGGNGGVSGTAPNPARGTGTYFEQGGNPSAGGTGIYTTSTTGISLTNTTSGQILGGVGGLSISQEENRITLKNADGGRGGDGVFGVATINNQGIILAGDGTDASAGNNFIRNPSGAKPSEFFQGANGGAGGNGIVLENGAGIINNSGTITAGHAGVGGPVPGTLAASSGNGGSGGSGIIVATGSTVTNTGTIIAGNAAAGAIVVNTDPTNGNGGNGGDGIRGSGITVINSGTIRAGSGAAAGSGQAGNDGYAARLLSSDSGNTLEIRNGSDMHGFAVAEGAGNVFVLGGDQDATFSGTISSTVDGTSAYQGFQTFRKSGASKWTLASSYDESWQIRDGILRIGNDGILSNAVTIDTGTGDQKGSLVYDQSGDRTTTFGGAITGTGDVRQAGQGTLILTGNNDYSGNTIMADGILSVGSDNAIGTGNLVLSGGFLQITGTDYNSTGKSATVSSQNTGIDIVDISNTFTVSVAISGIGELTKRGAGALALTGHNAYNGGTIIEAGNLWLGDGTTDGSVVGDISIALQSTLFVKNSGDTELEGSISGDGGLTQDGTGKLTLSGNNGYTGGTLFNIGVASVKQEENLGDFAGELSFNGGTLEVTGTEFNSTSRTINWGAQGGGFDVFDTNNTFTLSTEFTGSGALKKLGAGTLALTGDSSTYTGTTSVNGGNLRLDDANLGGAVNVLSSGALGGHGTIGGSVNITDGGQLFGQTGQVISFENGLTFTEGGRVNVTLNGGSSDDALFNVTGDLALRGNLDVNDISAISAGIYRIFDYSGNLTQNNMTIGNTPGNAADFYIQTAISNQVNLVNTQGQEFFYWDGTSQPNDGHIGGGTGVWNASNGYWTDADGLINAGWKNRSFAVFGSDVGTVTVAAGYTPNVNGMQFMTDGYILTGNAVMLAGDGNKLILVGDGLHSSKSMKATIASELQGTEGFTKSGYGTLTLMGANTYTGTTTVAEGILELADGGSINASSNIVLSNTGFDEGQMAVSHSDIFSFSNEISGTGGVIQRGTGTTIFAGNNSFSGGLTVESGTAKAGITDNAFGSGTLKIKAGAKVDLDKFNATVGSLISYDPNGVTGDGDIALGSGTLTLNQTMHGNFSGVISGQGGLSLSSASTDSLTLLGSNVYGGATTVSGGTLIQGTQDAFSSVSAYNVGTAGTLELGGYSTHVASLSNRGTVDFGGSGGTVLSIAGNYVGGKDSKLLINTVLGGDDAQTDILKVGGNTSGNTTMIVTNRNGFGKQTVNGIKVVDVVGQSNGVFNLQGDYTTKDGHQAILTNSAYAYTLQKNSKADPNDGNWYLVSQNTNAAPVDPTNPTDPTDPRYSAAAPVYESYAATLQALNKLPTLQQRVGNRYVDNNAKPLVDGKSGEIESKAIWGRIEGAHARLEYDSTAGLLRQDVNTYIMQAGVDGQVYENENGKLIASIVGQYGNVSSSVRNLTGDGGGDIRTQGWGLGGTVTWYGDEGFYVDGQGQANWYNSDLNVDASNPTLNSGNNGFGYALSIEAGQRFALDELWSLTPQAQMMWSSVDFNTITDTYGASISNRDGNSLSVRLGLAANYANNWKGEDGLMVNTSFYGIANLYQELLGGTKIDYSGTRMSTNDDGTWAGIGAGGTYAWADRRYALYGEGSVNTSLNHFANSYKLKANVGLRVNW